MICVSTAHGEDSEALGFFSEMLKEGLNPDKVVLVSVFGACANLPALAHGQLIHANAVEFGLETDVAVGNALINMYGKCGCHADSHKVFRTMPTHNVISWTALIEVEAYLGCPVAALDSVWQMRERGVEFNDVSFVNILSACSHAGLVNEACFYFKSMVQDCDVAATVEHYSSMIDLFGRAGRLEEAELVIRRMSVPPNAIIWESLLSSCRIHGDTGRGRKAAEQAIKMDSRISSPYVLLANIYSSEGRRDDAAKIWKLMFERGLTMCNAHVDV
jgi:pentatricopeptide repeat protein